MNKLFLLLTIFVLSLVQGVAQMTSINGDYALKNVHTGKYVRIKDANTSDGTPIVAYSPVNWKCVTWNFQSGAGDSHILKNLFSGKTLQPVHGDAKAGVAMEEQPIRDQRYDVIAAGNKQYFIRLHNTELYLTPADAKGETNTSIILAAKKDGDLQRWTLVEQHPTM